ncbi:MAG: DUF7450 family protein, partial [Candidatus Binatia bacterium]
MFGVVGLAMSALLLGAATSALAHEDPPGCFETGPAIIVSVFRANGTTGVTGSVSECETINYRATLQKAQDLDSICAFSGGTFKLTTPDGVVHDINLNVPCIGGTGGEGCDPAVDFIQSALIPYTVSTGDIVGGLITASAVYTGGVAHDSPLNTAGVGATTPKSTPVVLCSDNNNCTTDICDPAGIASAACSNPPVVCQDNNACTDNVCNPADGQCQFPVAVTCNDNSACTSDACNPATGLCVFTPIVTCNDNNGCTTDVCNPANGQCVFTDVVTPTCTDNNLCTNDVCNPQTGLCEFPSTGLVCTDNNLCTNDSCNPATGTCQFISTGLVCNDNNVCTSESCDPTTGACKTTNELNCEDNNLCTNDGCNPATGCSHAAVVCVDNNLCTQDSCVPASGCTFTDISAQCDDDLVCTIDSCDPQQGCVHTPSTAPECVGPNHFQCYEVKPFAFGRIGGVTVQDRYGSVSPPIRTPHPFCLPSDKRGEDPSAATDKDHLLGYADPLGPVRIPNQVVTNQFGSVTVDLIRRTYLMVPTAKSLSGPTPPLATPVADHFQCYLVKRSTGTARFVPQRGVAATDQFGSHAVDLLRPRWLCVPANKNNEDPTAPQHADGLL